MTVDELIAKLAALPGDYEVIVDQGRDYENYGEATMVERGMFETGFCGGTFKYLKDLDSDEYPNSVIIL